MFEKLGPSVARSDSGYEVCFIGRSIIEYKDNAGRVEVETESGLTMAIYESSIQSRIRCDGTKVELTPDERGAISRRIQDALAFLGVDYVLE